MTPVEQLAALRPTERRTVMDLVAEAGVDVSGWARRADGTAVTNPAANPNYCYEWTFGKAGEPIVFCVWHQALVLSGDRLIYQDNLRELASKLTRWGHDRSYQSDFRSRALRQAKRATQFDFAIQRAARIGEPVRVILLLGDLPTQDDVGERAATVDFRRLDAREWQVESYEDGRFLLVRSQAYATVATTPVRELLEVRADAAVSAEDEPTMGNPELEAVTVDVQAPNTDEPEPVAEPWIDQFTLLDTPERHAALSNSFVRAPEVRLHALRRANGHCELCGAEGFRTEQGVYLETHHVIPLSEGGPDHPSNVVALCANDHRRAHFSAERDSIRQQLLATLAVMNASSSGG